jgi:hypothetical protein
VKKSGEVHILPVSLSPSRSRSGISPSQNVSRINPVVGRVAFLMGRLQNSLSLGFPTGDSVLKVVRVGRPFKICDICWEFPRNMFRVKGTNKLRSYKSKFQHTSKLYIFVLHLRTPPDILRFTTFQSCLFQN